MNKKFLQKIANGENVKLVSSSNFIAVTNLEDDEEDEEFFCHDFREYPKDAEYIDESELDHSDEYTLFQELPFKEYKGYKNVYLDDDTTFDHFHHEDDFSNDPEFADLPTLADLHKNKTM